MVVLSLFHTFSILFNIRKVQHEKSAKRKKIKKKKIKKSATQKGATWK